MAAKNNGTPFTEHDLQRPADEGRSLHDEVSEFLRVKVGVATPITPRNMPKSSIIAKAFRTITTEEKRFQQLLADLQATQVQDLWPGADGPPATKEGVTWHAAHSLIASNRMNVTTRSMSSHQATVEGQEKTGDDEEQAGIGKRQGDEDDEEEEPTICEICEACPCEWIEYGPAIVENAKETFPQLPKDYNKDKVHPKIRYASYIYYTYAKYGNLGRGNRLKPSKCVEDNIFSLWPSEKRTGFKYSKRQLEEDDSNDKESTNNASRLSQRWMVRRRFGDASNR